MTTRQTLCCRDADCRANRTLDADVPQSDIASLYDGKAGVYDIWAWLTESRARERAIALTEIIDGQTILEVAVGTGLAFQEIVRRNPHGDNSGVDLSPGMLRRAKKRMQSMGDANYRLALGSAETLDQPTGSVDILFNNYMFDLIAFEQMDAITQEFHRVLKPGGKLVLVNMTHGEGFGSGVYERIYQFSPRMMGGCRGVAMADRLQHSGFEIISREYIQQALFPSEVILAQAL
ncbi:MAG: methyltransferase domain-containing protein [Candidatus Thiodiazotropha sp.]